ncbi:MAG TPA: glutathione S-transferase family protein [Candidatus Binataceae bacterium]|nr:glutathione S-transferase family protein [Candidatus Binataceae bacterium]
MPRLVLYHTVASPFARKVRIAMAEKKISCQKIALDFSKGENRTPEYLRLNPHGRVPTLLVDSIPIYESTSIVEYLNEAYPEPALLPRSLVERARVRMIEETIDGSFIAALRTVLFNVFRLPEPERNQKAAREARTQIEWHNEWLDHELAGRSFVVNGGLSIADIAGLCALEFQKRLEIGIDPKHRDLITWYERMKSRPSAKALTE